MQVSLSNLKTTESTIRNMEVQVGQLARQLVETSRSSFVANMEKNPKEECKVIFTKSQRRENEEREKRDEEVLKDVSNEEGEKNKSIDRGDKVLPIKTKSQLAREARKEIPSVPVKDIPCPLVPSKKDKERYFAQFLDIFNKLEITILFREALQHVPLYTKFLKDLLTKKKKYINDDSIMVEGNCSVVIQKILPQKFKDPRNVTIPCSIGDVSMGKALIDLGASINLMALSMC